MGKARSMRRAMQRKEVPVKMVPIFTPLYLGLQTAARDLGTDVASLIHNTLQQGLSNWAKEKERNTLIQVPGRSTLTEALRKEAKHG